MHVVEYLDCPSPAAHQVDDKNHQGHDQQQMESRLAPKGKVPCNAEELRAAASDALLLTAYQYMTEHPESDLAELLVKRKDFETALQGESAASA